MSIRMVLLPVAFLLVACPPKTPTEQPTEEPPGVQVEYTEGATEGEDPTFDVVVSIDEPREPLAVDAAQMKEWIPDEDPRLVDLQESYARFLGAGTTPTGDMGGTEESVTGATDTGAAGDTDEPGAMDETGTTPEPGATDEAGTTGEPGGPDEAGTTAEPGTTDDPGTTPEPGATGPMEGAGPTGTTDQPAPTDPVEGAADTDTDTAGTTTPDDTTGEGTATAEEPPPPMSETQAMTTERLSEKEQELGKLRSKVDAMFKEGVPKSVGAPAMFLLSNAHIAFTDMAYSLEADETMNPKAQEEFKAMVEDELFPRFTVVDEDALQLMNSAISNAPADAPWLPRANEQKAVLEAQTTASEAGDDMGGTGEPTEEGTAPAGEDTEEADTGPTPGEAKEEGAGQ